MVENEEKIQRQRENEFKARLDKIQKKMATMADTVVKNERDKRLSEERRLLALQSEKERVELEEETKRKNKQITQNRMVQNYLNNQMEFKKEKKVNERQKDRDL